MSEHSHTIGYRNDIVVPAPPCEACEAANRCWDELLARDGIYEVARKISKLPSYRAYTQRWPYDGSEKIVSLEYLMDMGFEQADHTPSLESEIIAAEAVESFIDRLTPIQRDILAKLRDGWKPKEIFQRYGYRNTGGIRWHKFVMRLKYLESIEGQPTSPPDPSASTEEPEAS